MIEVNSTNLAKALAFLGQAYKNKTTMPIMQNVKLISADGWLTMTQTNGEQTLTFSIPANGDDDDFTVELKKLADRAAQYAKDKPVKIEVDEACTTATVKCQRSKITLNALPSNQFPDSRTPEVYSDIVLYGEDLKKALTVVKGAQAVNDVRYYLNGVNLSTGNGKMDILASDGHRLHHSSLPIESDVVSNIIIPNGAVNPIYRYLDGGNITIRVSDNSLRIADEKSSIQTSLVDGRFPNWQAVVPKDNNIIASFDKEELIRAIKASMITTSEKFKCVTLSISSNAAMINSSSPDKTSSEEVVDCTMQGVESLEVGVNGHYILDAISAVHSDIVQLKFENEATPILIKDGDYEAIVMPMRL